MSERRRSLQDRIRERQKSSFVGRDSLLIQYRENLRLSFEDERRRFLFNIHGNAGVGKTFLVRQLREIATDTGALTSYIDETTEDITSAMAKIAADIGRTGVKLGDFEKRAAEYRQRRHELESDPQAPAGIAAFLTKTAVMVGLAAARDIPLAGSLVAPVDATIAAEKVDQAREYLARKFGDYKDVRLLLSPSDELTPIFVAGLNRVATGRAVALFVDTYERTGLLLDMWLRDLYSGRYGELPETLIATISGQKPLDPNLWSEYLPVISDIPLEPFSEAEARQFLGSKGIGDEATVQVILALSGRLPLWLATLADARLQGSAEIGDPSGNAVERFLKWEDNLARREIAMAAALPRLLNQDVLAVIAPPDQARELFGWLRGLPFVSQRGEFWAYHDVVRAAMLRLRHAEAPAEWRSEHYSLARANARWASESVGETQGTWANENWINYTREEIYHTLCADSNSNLPRALASAVKAAEHGLVRARHWAALIGDAGRDVDNSLLKQWGQRLIECVNSGDLILYLSCLINDASLDRADRVAAYEVRGEMYRRLGRYDQALADFNHALELRPDDSWAIGSRGQTYRSMGRYEEAIADLNRAIEVHPDKDWMIVARGQTRRLMGRYEEALTDFNRAIELHPGRDWIIAHRGETYRLMDRYDEALADFTRAIELHPENAWAIGSRGQTYQSMGRYEEALADFTRAIELHPEYAWVIGSRGQTYQSMGRYEEGLADLNRVIDLFPQYAWAIGIRSQIYRLLGRYDEAMADLNRAIALESDHDDYADKRVEIHQLIGKAPEVWSSRGEGSRSG
jgi:tetratricopeptide (TPR) repeat protein